MVSNVGKRPDHALESVAHDQGWNCAAAVGSRSYRRAAAIGCLYYK